MPDFWSKDLTIDLSIFRAFGHIEASELHDMMLFSWHRAKVFFQPELEVIIQQNPQKQWKHHRFVHFWDEIVASVGSQKPSHPLWNTP